MKALLVTSRVTFVPGNYDELVTALASQPEVHGLLVLDNRSLGLLRTAAGLALIGARGLARSLIRNQLSGSHHRRVAAYQVYGKKVWVLPDINGPEAASLVRSEGIDLIVNARTRFIYREPMLSLPALGCINIHHGLLPEQRGTMCDLWSLAAGKPAGFSVHYMNARIDAGELLATVPVSDGSDKDYLAYLQRSERRELAEVKSLLRAFAKSGRLPGSANVRSGAAPHCRNPSPSMIRQMLSEGMKL